MVRLLSLQTPPEMMLRDFAARSGLADAAELARVVAVAKRLGGNYLPVLKRMASAMDARRMVREETEAALAKIMWILAETRESAEVAARFYTPVGPDMLYRG